MDATDFLAHINTERGGMSQPALIAASRNGSSTSQLASLSVPSAPYVLHLAHLPSSFVSASSDDVVRVHDRRSLSVVAEARFHNDSVMGFRTPRAGPASGSLVTVGKDARAAVWDPRAGWSKPVGVLEGPRHAPYLCVDVDESGTCLATGTELTKSDEGEEALIDIWDMRSPSVPTHTYTESHSDDITGVAFRPSHLTSSPSSSRRRPPPATTLLSASSDGLLCTYDVSVTDEDDAVLGVGNMGTSVARAGWGGARAGSGVADGVDAMETDGGDDGDEEAQKVAGLGSAWAVSDMQTFGVWDADEFDTHLPALDVRNIRCLAPAWTTDYVIDAASGLQMPDIVEPEGTILFVGDQAGNAAILTVPAADISASSSAQWSLRTLLPSGPSGHSDIVRSVSYDAQDGILLTGGEDGKICLWNMREPSAPGAAPAISPDALPNDSDMSPGRQNASFRASSREVVGNKAERHKPYKRR